MYYAVIAQCCITVSLLFVIALLPVSILRTRRHRSTIEEYAEFRRANGAPADEWPSRGVSHELMVNPTLILLGGVLVALLALLGAMIEFFRPDPFHTMPGYQPVDADPMLYVAVAAGALAAVVLAAWAWRRYEAPWFAVGDLLRRAVDAKSPRRERLFEAALKVDPEMQSLGEQSPTEASA